MNEDVRAIGSEALGDGAADAARSSGNEGDLVSEWLGHENLRVSHLKWETAGNSSRYPNNRIL
jgi:hypothetical protein